MKKTQNTKTQNTNTATAEAVEFSNAESVQASKKAESKQASKKAESKQAESKQAKSVQASKQAESKQASKKAESKQAESKKTESVKIETLYSNMKAVIDLSKFANAEQLACNELNFNEYVINQIIDNNLVALAKIYAHKTRYDLLLNKSRLTVLFANALKANELLHVSFNAKKLETKKQYVVELNLQQLEQYICILFDLVKKQDTTQAVASDNKQ